MVTLTRMGGLSIRFLAYFAPEKGVTDGLKPERSALKNSQLAAGETHVIHVTGHGLTKLAKGA